MKKTLTIVIAFILALLVFSNISIAALSATATLNPSSTKAKKGEQVTINLVINPSDDGYMGFEGYLDYDKDFFSSVSASKGKVIQDILAQQTPEEAENDPDVQFAYSSSNGLIGVESVKKMGSGVLVVIKATISENTTKESGQIGFKDSEDLTIFNSNGDSYELGILPISIELDDSQEPPKPENNTTNEIENRVTPGNNTSGNQSGNKNNPNTAANSIFPNAGKTVMLPLIGILAVTGTAAYVRYKKTKID